MHAAEGSVNNRITRVREKLREKKEVGMLGVIAARARLPEYVLRQILETDGELLKQELERLEHALEISVNSSVSRTAAL